MKITACNDTFYNAAVWYAHALGIADREFDLTIDYGDDPIGAAQIIYHKGVAIITMNTTQDESDDELELLAHEMVHLRQYVTGQMVDDILSGLTIWEGTAYIDTNDAATWAYWNAPWELEAFSRQRGLNFMRSIA